MPADFQTDADFNLIEDLAREQAATNANLHTFDKDNFSDLEAMKLKDSEYVADIVAIAQKQATLSPEIDKLTA